MIATRDIEKGLGEEWERKGTRGTTERPHWGHNFFRASHPQHELPRLEPVAPVAPVAAVNPVTPVTEVVPVSREGMNGHAIASNDYPPGGWV